MTKYLRIIAEDDEWYDRGEFLPFLSVDSSTPEFTGLLDQDGNPIIRMPRPIGFGRDNEW